MTRSEYYDTVDRLFKEYETLTLKLRGPGISLSYEEYIELSDKMTLIRHQVKDFYNMFNPVKFI